MSDYRTILPIQKPNRPNVAMVDVRDSAPPQVHELLRPPKGAPNVVVVLLDDMGFGAPSVYGGPCDMPSAERLSQSGLQYTRFHTTALCSPTRASLLSGRNHHQVGMGSITETAAGYPGYDSFRPATAAPLAEMLKLNGYNTAAFGKWHQTPVWECQPTGPFSHWPTGEGFEKFWGFLAGEVDQWNPTLFENTTPLDTPKSSDDEYHFSEDLADQTIKYIREQQAMMPDKPFFTYVSFGATHAPHHAPKSYIERYKGKFDKGWDKIREETFENQIKLGLIPKDCQLTERPEEIQAWDSLSADEKRLYARMMEVYAAFATHADEQAGRIFDAIEELGVMENTLIFYILGDNGASGEGNMSGTLNEYAAYNGIEQPVEMMLKYIDDIGSQKTFNHYPVGWAHAMNTPYQWTKQCASHWGGTRNGCVVHWPEKIQAKGEKRTQFFHVVDIAPTVLAAASLPEPTMVNGAPQIPLSGYDMAPTFDEEKAPEEHTTQYFEIFGNRAIYHNGWTAVTLHNVPWELLPDQKSFLEDDWELYAPGDWAQANNIAKDEPEMLAKLKELFLIEAAKNNVFPLDDRKAARMIPDVAGRPDIFKGRTSMKLYRGMNHLNESSIIDVKNRSHTVTAKISVGDGGHGVVIAQGGRFGGWSLYLDKDSKPTYAYNWVGMENYVFKSETPLSSGDHELRLEFAYHGDGVGKGADVSLYVDGEAVAGGPLERTVGYAFSLGDGAEIGQDAGPVVAEDYGSKHGYFDGEIAEVLINVDPKQHHDPIGKMNYYMARQ